VREVNELVIVTAPLRDDREHRRWYGSNGRVCLVLIPVDSCWSRIRRSARPSIASLLETSAFEMQTATHSRTGSRGERMDRTFTPHRT
jgi:hypothetical protein